MTQAKITIPPTVLFPRPQRYVLVGCGGTGARILPALVKMLGPEDTIYLIDGDRVEEHNLLRQHFVRRDIGRYKAEVLAQRYALERGPALEAQCAYFTDSYQGSAVGGSSVCLIGCVDNREARQTMRNYMTSPRGARMLAPASGLYIDCGNERRAGQVLLSVYNYQAFYKQLSMGDRARPELDDMVRLQRDMGEIPWDARRSFISNYARGTFHCDTIHQVLPQLLDPAEADPAQVPCAVRIDTQTVAANMMAAALAINLLTQIIDGIPLSTLGAFFTTDCVTTPVQLERVEVRAHGGYQGVASVVKVRLGTAEVGSR